MFELFAKSHGTCRPELETYEKKVIKGKGTNRNKQKPYSCSLEDIKSGASFIKGRTAYFRRK